MRAPRVGSRAMALDFGFGSLDAGVPLSGLGARTSASAASAGDAKGDLPDEDALTAVTFTQLRLLLQETEANPQYPPERMVGCARGMGARATALLRA